MKKIIKKVACLLVAATCMAGGTFGGVSVAPVSVQAATTEAEMKIMDENGAISAIYSPDVKQVFVDDTNPSTTTVKIPRAEDVETSVDDDVNKSGILAAAIKYDVMGPHYFYRFKLTNSVFGGIVSFGIYYQNEYGYATVAHISSQKIDVSQGNVAEVTTKLDEGVRNTGKYGYGTYYVVAYTSVNGSTIEAPVQIEISCFYDDILDTMDDAVTETDSKLTVDKADYPARTDLMTPGYKAYFFYLCVFQKV